jgi:hypothetical protein
MTELEKKQEEIRRQQFTYVPKNKGTRKEDIQKSSKPKNDKG